MQGDEPPARSARRALEEAEELAVAGDGLVEDADLEAAEAAFRAALDKALVALGPGGDDSRATSVSDSPITPWLYRALGEVSFLAGRYEAALHWLVQARDLEERNERPLALALDLTNTGVVRRHMGDLDGALADYRRVAEIEQQHEASSVDRAITLNNMGRIHQVKGDLTAAQGLFDEALSLLEDTDAETMVIRSNFLGNVAVFIWIAELSEICPAAQASYKTFGPFSRSPTISASRRLPASDTSITRPAYSRIPGTARRNQCHRS